MYISQSVCLSVCGSLSLSLSLFHWFSLLVSLCLSMYVTTGIFSGFVSTSLFSYAVMCELILLNCLRDSFGSMS